MRNLHPVIKSVFHIQIFLRTCQSAAKNDVFVVTYCHLGPNQNKSTHAPPEKNLGLWGNTTGICLYKYFPSPISKFLLHQKKIIEDYTVPQSDTHYTIGSQSTPGELSILIKN